MLECVKLNLLKTIENSLGSKIFTVSLWDTPRGVVDIARRDGTYRVCALYTSSVLLLFHFESKPLCRNRHATVEGFLRDVENSGWFKIDSHDRMPGSIIVWEEVRDNHHVGFYVGDGKAVSACNLTGLPKRHHWLNETNDATRREVVAVYSHKVLYT